MRCGGCATCPSDAALLSSITIRRRLGPPEVIHSYPPNRTCSMFGCNARVDSYKVRKTAPAASSLPYGWGGTTLSAESQVQEERDGIARTTAANSPNAGDEPNPATQSIDVAEVARADVRPSGAAASKHPPQIPLAPMKRMQARFNPLADGLMYLVVFVGGFVGVGFRRATDLLLPSVNGSPFVVGTFGVEYARLLPVCDADRIHGDRVVAAPAGCGRSSAVASGLVCLADCRRCPA